MTPQEIDRKISKAQLAFLHFANDFQGLRDGQAERNLQTHYHGAAAEKIIYALERKGLVSGDMAEITEQGIQLLSAMEKKGEGND